MKSGKRHMTKGVELPNEVISTLREKKTYKYLGILKVDAIKQVEMKEKIKRVSQKNQKINRDKHQLQELCQRDKYLGCSTRKILGVILEVDQVRTNRPENKKINDHA